MLPQVAAPSTQTAERIDYDSTLEGDFPSWAARATTRSRSTTPAPSRRSTAGSATTRSRSDRCSSRLATRPQVPSPDDRFDTTETTRGFLSNGVSQATTILGGEGDDRFTVFRNHAYLRLEGGLGDDSFTLRSFALVGSTAVDPGLGGDLVLYAENAPVVIDGGPGVDGRAFLGTEFRDTFVITPEGVSIAGLQTQTDRVELLELDGLEGNDRFVVLGTTPSVSTGLFGGAGSDTFDVGGDPVAPPRAVSGVQGPLAIEGGDDPDADTSVPSPLLYIAELDTHTFVSRSNSNLLVHEPEQVDVATVLDTDSLADAAGVLTDTRVTGLGMGADITIGSRTFAGGITYGDLELLRLHLGGGSDRLLVESTHGGVTEVSGGSGADEIHARTVGGPTVIRGEEGDDTVDIGSSFDGSWFGVAVDDESAPPAGTVDRIRALLLIDGGNGYDTVRVDDSADATGDVATLTGRTLDGLDLASAIVQTVTLVDAAGGTFTLTVGTRTTAPLPFAAAADAAKAALLGLALPHVSDVTVNRAGNVLTIGFLGDESLQAADVTLAAGPANVEAVAQSLVQTVQMNAAAGEYAVMVGAGLAAFTFAAGMSADTFRDALIAAIRSIASPVVSADGLGVEKRDVLVDLVGSTYVVTYQGLLRGLVGDRFGLAVAAASAVTPAADAFDVTIEAVGGTYALVVSGARTYPLAAASDAAAIATALNALLGTTTLNVTELAPTTKGLARTFRVGGLPSGLNVDDRNLVRPVVVAARRSGIDYASVDRLILDLGSGDDVVNVRGTTAVTDVYSHAGDDRFSISSLAAETVESAQTTDYVEGNLDALLGNLNLSAGEGRHRLFVSDEAAVAGDPDVLITDAPSTATRLSSAEIEIAGLAPAPITYGASAAGSFAGGITVWSGFGADTISVDGTHNRAVPGVRTITTLNTGLGDDVVTVDLKAGQDGFFVLNTQGPFGRFTSRADADTVTALASTLPLVIFGGQGDDAIAGGAGGDVIFGDRGRVLYFDQAEPSPTIPTSDLDDASLAALVKAAVAVLGGGGPGDRSDGLTRLAAVAVSIDPAIGGNDTVGVTTGGSVVIGGAGNDSITLGRAGNLAFGDSAFVTWGISPGGTSSEITGAASVAPAIGGNDSIVLGTGRALVVAGQGADTVIGGSAANIVVGDNARIDGVGGNPAPFGDMPLTIGSLSSTSPSLGGDDAISGGAADDLVVGGVGNDTISAGDGRNLVIGDNGTLSFAAADPYPDTLDLAQTTDPAFGGADRITTGAGDDAIFGGVGSDAIDAGGGDNAVYGDDGAASFYARVLVRVDSLDDGDVAAASGGDDVIVTGPGRDVIVGGFGDDGIAAGDGQNVVLGDSGAFIFNAATGRLVSAASTAPSFGGNDHITAGLDRDVIVGGDGRDTITADGGADVIAGDGARMGFDADGSLSFLATNGAGFGGSDTITTGAGRDIVFGGFGGDRIDAGDGDNVVFGDDGAARFDGGALVRAFAVDTGDDGAAFGGDDEITTGAGRDVVAGGVGNDRIGTGRGGDVVLGDSGAFIFNAATGRLVSAASTAPSFGGNDHITAGLDRDVIVGGDGRDTITADGGADVIAGDGARMGFDADGSLSFLATNGAGFGGSDTITTGAGRDIVFGGFGGDRIDAGDGDNVVFGDDGAARFDGGALVRAFAVDTGDDGAAFGGDDEITTGAGRDVVAGGVGNDRIGTGRGGDVVLGDSGAFIFNAATGRLVSAASTAPSFGGNDHITAGLDRDVIVGGDGRDTITADGGADVIAGDNARMSFGGGLLQYFATVGAGLGDSDEITAAEGDDVVFGGTRSDAIDAGDGLNVVFGDDGAAFWSGQTLVRVFSTNTGDDGPAFGGNDVIVTGSGPDVVIGGFGNDRITTHGGDDVVFGDSGGFTFAAGTGLRVSGATTAPAFGGRDVITTGNGDDLIAGGWGDDTIDSGRGDDVVAGDGAKMSFQRGRLRYFATTGGNLGGNDRITTGPGNNVVFGGAGRTPSTRPAATPWCSMRTARPRSPAGS